MDYCKQYFGKSLRDLIYDDVVQFFEEEREESENLEFKSGMGEFNDVLTNKIIRGISSFLNSTGGLLIWGSPLDKEIERGKGKVCKGDLVPLKAFKEKDWLINRITREISYMPIGVNVERLSDGENHVYVFEVKESMSKPHQYNGIYHIRLDGQSKPAPHYLVDALFKRVTFPELTAEVEFSSSSVHGKKAAKIDVSISNDSRFLNAKNVSYVINTNMGNFGYDGGKSDKFIFNGILPKGMLQKNSHQLVYPLNLGYEDIIVDIQFFSDNSPLKISTYVLNIDVMYATINKTVIVENVDAHEAMDIIGDKTLNRT